MLKYPLDLPTYNVGLDLAPAKTGMVVLENDTVVYADIFKLDNPTFSYKNNVSKFVNDYIKGLHSCLQPYLVLKAQFIIEEPIKHSRNTTTFLFQWLLMGAVCSWLHNQSVVYYTVSNTVPKQLAGNCKADKQYMMSSANSCGFNVDHLHLSKSMKTDIADAFWLAMCGTTSMFRFK